MEFVKPDFNNIDLLKEYLSDSSIRDCSFCIGNIILWSEFYKAQFSIVEDMLVFFTKEEGMPSSFTFPIGKNKDFENDLEDKEYRIASKKAFDIICDYFDEHNIPIALHCVTPAIYRLINSWYPDTYTYEQDRDSYNYIYTVDKLSHLSGQKLHGKRNHINSFLKKYPDYVYEDVNSDNIHDCLYVLKQWIRRHQNTDNKNALAEYQYEYKIIEASLNNMDRLNMKGGLIRIDGVPVAFTIGEPICRDTYDIHFEKADDSIQGLYQIINREFVSRNLSEYTYVNREDDLGIEGLRKSKLSYYPDILYENGIIYKTKDIRRTT
ncbi:MAG: DUF2156 domain-containing protein [Coprococcus sp.]